MLDVLKSNIRLFEKAFCPSTSLDCTQEEFAECLMPEFSEEESNKKRTGVNAYKSFIDLFRRGCFKTVIILFYGYFLLLCHSFSSIYLKPVYI